MKASLEMWKNDACGNWDYGCRELGAEEDDQNRPELDEPGRDEAGDAWRRRFRFRELMIRTDGTDSRLRHARGEVRAAAKIIEKYFADRRVCEDRLRSLPMSPEWLRHIFRSETGMSIQQYQRRCQLWQAAMLLTCTSLCVCEIAEAVGLPETTYFGKLFREQYGESPRSFRENTFWGRRSDGERP